MSRPRTGNKQQRLTDAAIELFADRGYFHTTTAEISARAGVAAGTLYLYFDSKDDLLIAALNRFIDGFEADVLRSGYSSPTFEGRIDAFVHRYLTFLEEHPDLARVFLVELRQNTTALNNLATGMWKRYYEATRTFLREVRPGEAPVAPEVEADAVMILGTVETTVMRWLLGLDPARPTSRADALVNALTPGLAAPVEVL